MDVRYLIVFFAIVLVLIVVWLVNDFDFNGSSGSGGSSSSTTPKIESKTTPKLVWSTRFSEKTIDMMRWSVIASKNQINPLNFPSERIAKTNGFLDLKVLKVPITFQNQTYPYQSYKLTSNSKFLLGIFIVKIRVRDLENKKFEVSLQNYSNACNNLLSNGTIYIVKNWRGRLNAGTKINGKKTLLEYPKLKSRKSGKSGKSKKSKSRKYHTFVLEWTKSSMSWYFDSDIGVSGTLSGGFKIGSIQNSILDESITSPLNISLQIKANKNTKTETSIQIKKIEVYR